VRRFAGRSARALLRPFGYKLQRVDGRVPAPASATSQPNLIADPRVEAVLARMHAAASLPPRGPSQTGDYRPDSYAEYGFSIDAARGQLLYWLGRALGVTRVAEFATSVGLSTIYLAAMVRDNGGGTVIGSEIVPAKVAAARRNLADAGLADLVEIREGDARTTLQDLGGPIDMVLIDGWPTSAGTSVDRQVVEMIAPQVRAGGLVVHDNQARDYLEYVRDPVNGFLSISVPMTGRLEPELSLRIEPGG
jgi:predicted O-methyltransferase YrrM